MNPSYFSDQPALKLTKLQVSRPDIGAGSYLITARSARAVHSKRGRLDLVLLVTGKKNPKLTEAALFGVFAAEAVASEWAV